jgi:hypothetical protein
MSQPLAVCFDTETGGLNENKADLLTAYFCIMTYDYQILEELYLKLKPDDGRIPIAEAGALKVNGINIAEHLADPETVTYSEGQKLLEAMFKRHLKRNGRYSNLTPMGYNILGFDIRWVQKYLLPQDIWQSLLHYKNWDVMQDVDFLKRVGWFPATLGSLSSVVEYLQVPTRGAHNAKEDVLMTIDVAKKIVEIMKAKKEGGGSGAGTDLITLLEAE